MMKKLKESLNEFPVSNIAASFTVKNDFKLKTVELIPHYKKIGLVDGCSSTK